jgi:hypothetical protein
MELTVDYLCVGLQFELNTILLDHRSEQLLCRIIRDTFLFRGVEITERP